MNARTADLSPEAHERELKLELEPAAAQALRAGRVQGLSAKGAVRENLTSVYFDTKRFSLRRKGLSLRVRFDGDRRLQTVKGDGGAGAGVFDRPEWETEIKGSKPHLARLRESPFASAFPKRLQGRLKPVFRTEVERTKWLIRFETAEIEVALDRGKVIGAGKEEPFAEVELELKSGALPELFNLARTILPAKALKLGVLTKSERGYALVNDAAANSFKGPPFDLRPEVPAAEAFKSIVTACIRHFRLNERLLLRTRSAEALHQSRVALRRLRTAFSLFKEIIADDQVDELKDRLRSLSQLLGEARDLDVFIAKLQQPDNGMGLDDGELLAGMQRKREQTYDRLIAALQGTQFETLIFDVLAWSETGPWLADEAAQGQRQQPIESFAAAVLDRQRRKIRKRGRRLKELNPPARHDVRIEAKKLRYASEFFSSLAKGRKNQKRHAAFAKALEELQEHLGELNDLATSESIVRTAAAGPDGQFEADAASTGDRPTTEAFVLAQGRDLKRSLAAAATAFRDFSDAKPFWSAADGRASAKA